jgi:hypothetical protein
MRGITHPKSQEINCGFCSGSRGLPAGDFDRPIETVRCIGDVIRRRDEA